MKVSTIIEWVGGAVGGVLGAGAFSLGMFLYLGMIINDEVPWECNYFWPWEKRQKDLGDDFVIVRIEGDTLYNYWEPPRVSVYAKSSQSGQTVLVSGVTYFDKVTTGNSVRLTRSTKRGWEEVKRGEGSCYEKHSYHLWHPPPQKPTPRKNR